jgi:hypothetical protein
LREQTLVEALADPPPIGPAATTPGVLMCGPVLAGPLLRRDALNAEIRKIIHPGNAGPEPRYVPSAALADFVRSRDLTCRFPGCDEPAWNCDLDHTIPYPVGPTQASNLKCLCRKNHLLKTFWSGKGGWRDRQLPDGAVIWTHCLAVFVAQRGPQRPVPLPLERTVERAARSGTFAPAAPIREVWSAACPCLTSIRTRSAAPCIRPSSASDAPVQDRLTRVMSAPASTRGCTVRPAGAIPHPSALSLQLRS